MEGGISMETQYFGIGEAIEQLKQGKKVRRKFWVRQEKSLFLTNLPAQKVVSGDHINYFEKAIAVNLADGSLEGWVPNFYDLFADDYYVVD